MRFGFAAIFTIGFVLSAQASAEEAWSVLSPDQLSLTSKQADSHSENKLRAAVSRNPDTGDIEITAGSETSIWALSLREKNMLSRSDEGLQATELENGAVAINLQGRYQSMATATSHQSDLQLSISCSIIDVAPIVEKLNVDTN